MVQATCPSPIGPRCVDGFQTDSRGRQACRICGTVPKRSSLNCGNRLPNWAREDSCQLKTFGGDARD